jgi:hypothetical protein
MIAQRPARSADRENLAKQQAVLAELKEAVGKSREMIRATQELIRQLDLISDAIWRFAIEPAPGPPAGAGTNQGIIPGVRPLTSQAVKFSLSAEGVIRVGGFKNAPRRLAARALLQSGPGI